jgi:hypothetical protein
MTTQRALQTFEGLNERQRTWLLVIYRHDQQAEEWAKGAWTRGENTQPASVWRWLEYGLVDTPLADGRGQLQQALYRAKVWDQGAGATMAVLTERGLIQTKTENAVIGNLLSIKLTTAGRAAARAGGADDLAAARRKPKGLLSETVWSMLVAVHRAGDKGLERYASGAWQSLADRDPALITIESGRSYSKNLIRMAPDGTAHYRDHWHEYARLYPSIDAPSPNPSAAPIWPAEVDEHLNNLADVVASIGQDLRSIDQRRRDIPASPKATRKETPEQAEARKLRRKLSQLDQRVQDELARQREQVYQLYRTAVARYVAVAVAVTTAVAEGTDPRPCLAQEPATLSDDSHLLEATYPTTGLRGVDRDIAAAHHAAQKGPEPQRRRGRSFTQLDRDLQADRAPAGPTLAAVRDYAAHLRQLSKGVQLVRLLLRRADEQAQ